MAERHENDEHRRGESGAGGELRPHGDVIAQRVEDDVVLVHLGTNEIYVLNRTAARAWELITDGHASDGILERLTTEFDADRETIAGELDRLLDDLTSRRLVERA